MSASQEVSFAFQPLLSTRTGRVIAVEALPMPSTGTIHTLLKAASRAGQLTQTDVALAGHAVLAAEDQDPAVPLHINVLASTAAHPDDLLKYLAPALRHSGRHSRDVTLEIGTPFCQARRVDLLAGIAKLRAEGFRIALDGIGDGDVPLALLAEAAPDMIKISSKLLAGLPDDPAALAMLDALAHLAIRTETKLAAVNVGNNIQLVALSRLGVRVAQGEYLEDSIEDTGLMRALAEAAANRVTAVKPPRVTDFLNPAMMLPVTATADEVRETFANRPDINGVVLVDEAWRPQWSIDRSRFLLIVAGPYGHALHAKRGAARHADKPLLIDREATGMELLELVGDTDWERTGDDVVVTDEAGRCVGVVRVTEVIRGVADMKVEQAASLNPLTRLPGTDAVAREVDRRIQDGQMFVIAWLDVDSFKTVNDSLGFAAGDDLIRAFGRTVAEAAVNMPSVMVGHVGGDDFLLVTDLDEISSLATTLLDTEWSAEGMPVTVSLASLVCGTNSVTSYREASQLLAPLKQQAKAVSGSSWVLGRPGTDRVDILRGRAAPRGPQLSSA
ncbi:diguanylate cyclase (GGDEF)-like protein [Kibdelosporangium banguiense]|uniref:Diguanylate cyclase (GGDEF)-like protein n=1 Tax=Kibdelosporangium banguiense TaxID=1365924 RepID=A0ABS4TMV6_9PSEU|nr:GGDEF domain-containing protein [Kibdelosporangium banguiense]MBP2325737.1 diguanylate cyclase (GGDEF)-like protein [Kibdelosporangium banguiense]